MGSLLGTTKSINLAMHMMIVETLMPTLVEAVVGKFIEFNEGNGEVKVLFTEAVDVNNVVPTKMFFRSIYLNGQQFPKIARDDESDYVTDVEGAKMTISLSPTLVSAI